MTTSTQDAKWVEVRGGTYLCNEGGHMFDATRDAPAWLRYPEPTVADKAVCDSCAREALAA